ncbi:hypothetical protein ACWFMI_23640 [Nocardiopsis terrae]|uniref:hypothetical protein n=1 Tax=Streptomyces sp. NPDC057554 TaxID=3350538 RepID=UPI0036C8C1DD
MATEYKSGVLTFNYPEDATALYAFLRLVQELGFADYDHTTRVIKLLGKGGASTADLTVEEVKEIREFLTPVLVKFPRPQSHFFEGACQAVGDFSRHFGYDEERNFPDECIC